MLAVSSEGETSVAGL